MSQWSIEWAPSLGEHISNEATAVSRALKMTISWVQLQPAMPNVSEKWLCVCVCGYTYGVVITRHSLLNVSCVLSKWTYSCHHQCPLAFSLVLTESLEQVLSSTLSNIVSFAQQTSLLLGQSHNSIFLPLFIDLCVINIALTTRVPTCPPKILPLQLALKAGLFANFHL